MWTIEIGGNVLAAVIILTVAYLVVRWWSFAGTRR